MRKIRKCCISMQFRLDLKHHRPEGPPTPNLKGLIQALADLLLEAAGAESVKAKGGEHEHQDYA